MKKLLTLLAGLVTAAALLAPAASFAQTKSKLTQILERGTLRVGTTGDFNPMSIKDTATNTLTGFDVEAMTQLATDMGVKIEFVPAEWATLVNGIVSDRFDIFSGASLSMARAKTVAFSAPYLYAGTVPMVSKKAPGKFTTWESINNPNVTVAVLLGTVFEQQARAHFPKAKIRAVEKPATGYQEVLAGRAQVTVTSNVEAATLMKTYPDLQTVGASSEMRNKRPFAYPMPQGDEVWLTFVNNWISLKQAEGYFDTLEAKWLSAKKIGWAFLLLLAAGLLAGCGGGASPGSGYTWGWYILNPFQAKGLSNLQFLVGGLGATLAVSLSAIVLSVILGALVAIAGLSKVGVLYRASRVYVELFRSIPLLVLLLWVFYGLPVVVGLQLGVFATGVLSLALSDSAFEAEVFRAGIQSVPKGQLEAAKSIGLSWSQQMRLVVMPQAIKVILPALGNQFVYVMKMSSLVSVIGLEELTRRSNELNVSEYRPLEIYTFLVVEYLALIVFVSWLVRKLERRMATTH